MADKKNKVAENCAGAFYVDDTCIACDACVVEAPLFFKMNDIEGHAYVDKQPLSEKEIELCNRAMNLCPVVAIGNDGK